MKIRIRNRKGRSIILILNLFLFIITKIFQIVKRLIKFGNIGKKDLKYWWSLDGWEFEHAVARVLKINGYKGVKVTKGSHDNGVDIIFRKNGKKYIAQCKHYKTPVSPEPVRALWGVKEDFKADTVVMIASSGVSKMSLEFISKKKNYLLWTLPDIIRMAKKSIRNKSLY